MMKLCSLRYPGKVNVILSALTLHLGVVVILESLAGAHHELGCLNASNRAGETEVTNLHTAIFIHQDVCWLHVTMEHVC